MDVDVNEEKPFKVLSWKIPDTTPPKGMRVVRFDREYTLIIWFENHVLILKDVKADVSHTTSGLAKDIVTLKGVNIFDVFELNSKVYLVHCNGDLTYLKKMKGGNAKNLSLKFYENIRSGARNIHAIPDGFIMLLIIGGHWFLNVYKIADGFLQLTQSLKLGALPVEMPKCSCIVATIEGAQIEPMLIDVLFPYGNLRSDDMVVFIGFSTGQAYYFVVSPVPREDTTVPMLYFCPEPVVGIKMYQDPSTNKCSHILVVQQSGALVIISCHDNALKYSTLYLPSSVHCICLLDDKVLSSDKDVLWQSKLVRHEQGDIVLESSCLPVKNVDFFSCIEGQNEVIALMNDNTLLYLCLTQETVTTVSMASDYSAMQEQIIAKTEELLKLQEEIAKEDRELDAIHFSRRIEILRDKFELTVQVFDVLSHPEEIHLGATASSVAFNGGGNYIIEGTIVNSSGQEILSPSWTLQITIKTGSVSKLQVIDLNSTFGRNPLKFRFPFQLLNPSVKVEIDCHIAAELNVEVDTKSTTKWVVLPVGSAAIGTSYFFKPLISRYKINSKYIPGKVHEMQENLQKIADTRGVGDLACSFMEKPRTYMLNNQIESTYVLSLPEGRNHWNVWSDVTRHCLHRCEKELRTRLKHSKTLQNPNDGMEQITALVLVIGSKTVKLTLDTDCTMLEISSCDVQLLHAVKLSLISLLQHSEDPVHVDVSLARQVQEFMSEFELEQRETPNVVMLRNKWREITAQLPL